MTILSTIAEGSRKVFSIPPYTGSPTVKVNGVGVSYTAAGDFNLSLASTPVAGAVVEIDYQPAVNNVSVGSSVKQVLTSRTLTAEDNGLTLDCAVGVIVTIPKGLVNFGFAVRPVGTQVACAAGVTTNGASATLTTTAKVAAFNPTATQDAYDGVGV